MSKPATLWYRFEDNQWKYNHYEFGINKSSSPTPKSERQQVWDNMKWAKQYGFYQNALGRTKLVGESELQHLN